MKLNIIGNGFDMYHGLPCSYYYFGCFLASHHPEFYEEMSNMFGFPYLKCVGYEQFEITVDNIFWRTFEERLGEIDSLWVEDSLEDDLGLECSDPIDIETPEEENSQIIKEKFCEWINTTVNTEQNYILINSLIGDNRCHFEEDDYFVNFNYTQTLEEIYDISYCRIFHIHGKCEIDGEEDNLVVGHGNNEAIRELEEKIQEIKSETYYLDDQGVRNRLNEYKCELTVLKDLRKDVPQLLSALDRKLSSKESVVDEIWVWGLSCGSVDKPYMEYLRGKYPNARWMFSYFCETEREERVSYAEELELDNTKVGYFEFANSNSKSILSRIVEENGIEEFIN